MSKEEYINLRKSYPKTYFKIIFADQFLKEKIISHNKLYNLEDKTRPQQIYNYFFEIKEHPKCKICGKKTSFGGNFRFGYADYCGRQCSGKIYNSQSRITMKNNGNSPEKTLDKMRNNILKTDYIEVDIKEIKNIIKNETRPDGVKNKLISKFPNIYNILYKKYGIRDFNEDLYKFMNDLKETPKCNVCGIKEQNFISNNKGYSGYCSKKCGTINNNKKVSSDIKNYKEYNINEDELYSLEKTKKILKSLPNYNIRVNKNTYILYHSILFHTKWCENKKMKNRIYYILNDLKEDLRCSKCGKLLRILNIDNPHTSFKCVKCVDRDNSNVTITTRKKGYKNNSIWFNNNPDYELITNEEDYIKTGKLKFKHLVCGKETIRNHAYKNGCSHCITRSHSEIEIRDFLNEIIDEELIINKRTMLEGKEIDIYIPDRNIGIEYDGLYWHSETNGTTYKKYHLDKTTLAESKGMFLIHIFENEWQSKKDIVKSILKAKLGIYDRKLYGRNCSIKEINNKDKSEFLIENHIQGDDRSSIRLGLYYGEELVSVMTFGKRKITGKESSMELIRFCNKINTTVIGGASKLFNYYKKNYNYEFITYADRRYSQGKLYETLGLNLKHISVPNYYYFKLNEVNKLYHRAGFMKHKLEKKLKKFDMNLTEYQNMLKNNYDRIWDCGNYVFEYKI